jgi:phosphoribosylanthranilate isomerase
VIDAIRLLSPDVVDVSSGVECESGVKDPMLVEQFVAAVRSAAGMLQ